MAQFTKTSPVRRERGVVATDDIARNHNGGVGFKRDSKSELFMLAVTTMWGKDTFYETSDVRQQRFVSLVQKVTKEDPTWVSQFIPWLRDEAGIRTAAIVAAVEYAYVYSQNSLTVDQVIRGWKGRCLPRNVVGSTPQRADEPAEMLAYAMATRGRRLPKGLKKGIADAAERLYNGNTLLKYDSKRASTRPGDVLALTHAKPNNAQQAAVFTALQDARHGRKPKPETLAALPKFVRDDLSGEKSATWERASSRGKVNWDDQIDSMGVMALLRNLGNFDRDGISEESFGLVKTKISNVETVRKGRIFPMRFLTAWENIDSIRWGETLENGLNASLVNVPELDGHTLILWDCSGSMQNYESTPFWKQAGVFVAALARRAESSRVIAYSNAGFEVPVSKGGSILRDVEKVRGVQGLWGGTNTWGVLEVALREQPQTTRVVIVTDEQVGGSPGGYYRQPALPNFDQMLGQRPCYILNIAGYEFASASSDRVVAFAGLNDRCFTAIHQAESAMKGVWPWE